MQVLFNKVLVLPDPVKEKKGIMAIPKDAQKRSQEGTVVDFGPECVKKPDGTDALSKDIKILYSKNAGHMALYQGKEYLIMTDQEVFMIL